MTALAHAAAALALSRIVFTGDILLSRNVAHEMDARHASPWASVASKLSHAHLIGNFEGAVGPASSCDARLPAELCFAVEPKRLAPLAAAGFTAVSLENNHAHDLGALAAERSSAALADAGVAGLTFAGSPWFLRAGSQTIGLVAYDEVASPTAPGRALPDVELARKIRLAHTLSNVVVVLVHWGAELQDWPSDTQRRHARWLVDQGADLVVGHHPHVVQNPECANGRPVVYSLGNHVFDQKYPATKTGLVLDCDARGAFTCRFLRSQTKMGTSFPTSLAIDDAATRAWEACPLRPHPTTHVGASGADAIDLSAALGPRAVVGSADLKVALDGRHRHQEFAAPSLLWLDRFVADGDAPASVLALQQYASRIDGATDPRPYVYRVSPHGLVARWRGTALAWPLVDIARISDRTDGGGGDASAGRDYLCALHRGDSFAALDPTTTARRTRVYRWNGFGFSALESGPGAAALEAQCRARYAEYLTATPVADRP